MTSINQTVQIHLPAPWSGGDFTFNSLESVMFFVGPNGSGKSRFADRMRMELPRCRLLGTDRLSGMEKNRGLGILADRFQDGFQKNWFKSFKNAGRQYGSGIDTIVLLEERLDIRIRVEATLSHLFNRKIYLEWNSGNVIPKATLGTNGESYRLDNEECHGIKELLILLSHLYNEDYHYLIIDEPELNLHPQFQAFFMQEVHKFAGNPNDETGKKGVILITHSPFILDFRTVEDLTSIVSFSISHDIPKTMANLGKEDLYRLSSLVPRLNVYHKQLFFSDNPIFVEGIYDSQMIQAIQNARGASVASAGSCVIEAGGCEEVNKYVTLCDKFGKKAHFLYDLDSLFMGSLRGCVNENQEITSFLAKLGLGADFGSYCGALERILYKVIQKILAATNISNDLVTLRKQLDSLKDTDSSKRSKELAHARMCIVIQIANDRQSIVEISSENEVAEIEGRMNQIATALRQKNILLLTRGALENYLPSYQGDKFEIDESLKAKAVQAEINYISNNISINELKQRYGELYEAVCALPSKTEVDFDTVLMDVLSQVILEIQTAVTKHPEWTIEQLRAHVLTPNSGRARIFNIVQLDVQDSSKFNALIEVKALFGGKVRFVDVSHNTNAGMRNFVIM